MASHRGYELDSWLCPRLTDRSECGGPRVGKQKVRRSFEGLGQNAQVFGINGRISRKMFVHCESSSEKFVRSEITRATLL